MFMLSLYRKYLKPYIPHVIFRIKDFVLQLLRNARNSNMYTSLENSNKQSLAEKQGKQYVSIIILSFERGEQTKNTIEKILACTKHLKKEIIIWDNASQDPKTIRILKDLQKLLDVRVIFSDKNLRCSGGRKKAVRLARGDYVLFLDNDIEIFPGTIESLMMRLQESDSYKGACCHVIFPDGVTQFSGGRMVRQGNFVTFSLIDAGKKWNSKRIAQKQECDWVPGGATMFKRGIFEHVDFDTRYPNAYEDNDLSLQITQKYQGKVVNCPDAKVIHHHINYEFLKDRGTKRYQGTRYNKEMFIASWLYFYERWGLIIKDDFIFGLIGLRDASDDEIIRYVKKHVCTKE